jgi:hypothetical protein
MKRIVAAVATISGDMPQRAWDELDRRIDVCRVTRTAYTERL